MMPPMPRASAVSSKPPPPQTPQARLAVVFAATMLLAPLHASPASAQKQAIGLSLPLSGNAAILAQPARFKVTCRHKRNHFVSGTESCYSRVHNGAHQPCSAIQQIRICVLAAEQFPACTTVEVILIIIAQQEVMTKAVEMIERAVGKGRFAQRLASKITKDHQPPEHIKKALARIFARVPHA